MWLVGGGDGGNRRIMTQNCSLSVMCLFACGNCRFLCSNDRCERLKKNQSFQILENEGDFFILNFSIVYELCISTS